MINNDAVAAVDKIIPLISAPCSRENQKLRDDLYSVIVSEHEYQIKRITVPSGHELPIVKPTWKERLFLWYIAEKPVDSPNIGIYWYLEMRMFDYQHVINRLAAGGFLTTNRPSESLLDMSLVQLRSIAKKYSLPSSGSKTKLIDTISHSISGEEIDKCFPFFAHFALTEKGKKTVDSSAALIFYHRNRNRLDTSLSYENVEKYVSEYPSLTPVCAIILWEIKKSRNRDMVIQKILGEYERMKKAHNDTSMGGGT